MAGRPKGRCYVYVIENGSVPLYVGKGTGRRCHTSAKKHGGEAKIIKGDLTDCEAFKLEREMIREMMPENNICPGGNGGRSQPIPENKMPKALVGVVSEREWKQYLRQEAELRKEMERVGSQKYVAKFLCDRINEDNCAEFGVSKVDVFRLREVAHG